MTGEHDEPLPIQRFDYQLPPELIAQDPVEPRDAARLLVVERATRRLHDRHVRDLPDYLSPGDLLVANDSRVLPARLYARRASGGRVEILLLEARPNGEWLAVAKPAGRLRVPETLTLHDRRGSSTPYTVTIEDRNADTVRLRFSDPSAAEKVGDVPLPPYIRKNLEDPERYQTVYNAAPGSAAAPTAGLHFTQDLLERCEHAGISFTTVTLHVGLDTFQPMRVDDVRHHRIHSEAIVVSSHAVSDICRARSSGRRVVAVGTTTVRTLETISDSVENVRSGDITQNTRLYIIPGHRFRVVDAMITNFHLPRTSLLLLVSAFAGEDLLRVAYEHAIAQRYRFYSFGDAMLIV